ncbi:class I SAM-dependent methyltransferase [Rhodopseudomonas palustris]|uniref:class I SAM-dependent methyltransferase n=1 Tax=Rhodopseudomonas palustris TaxID=1076 RepID=UPI00069C1090|nr:class I SAM-dependent methyltransferase [Rhodopseudomonas palustris]
MSDTTYPPVATGEDAPIWNGSAFVRARGSTRVLAYGVGESGWSDELTELHESAADSGNHFIDVASRRHAIAELERAVGDRPAAIMEVGCSAGHLLADMRKSLPNARLTGGDYTIGTLEKLGRKMPGIPLIRFDLANSPLPSEQYDAMVLLNVLEHIEDDRSAVRHIERMLKPGGTVVIEVPGGPELYDDYDKQLQHFRRYTLQGICDVVESAGLVVERRNYLGALIYPPFYLAKKLAQSRPKPAAEREAHVAKAISNTSRFNPIGEAVMSLERALGRVVQYPRGIRCVVTARKPA